MATMGRAGRRLRRQQLSWPGRRLKSNSQNFQGNQGGFNQQSGQGNQQQQQGDTRPIQSSSMVDSMMCLPPVCASETRSFIRGQSMLLSRLFPITYASLSNPLCGVGKITRPGSIIRVTWPWWSHLRLEDISSPRYSWMEGAASISFIMRRSGAWG